MTFGESAPLSGQNDGPFSRRRNTGWASANMLTQQQRRRGNSVAFLIPHRRSLRRHGGAAPVWRRGEYPDRAPLSVISCISSRTRWTVSTERPASLAHHHISRRPVAMHRGGGSPHARARHKDRRPRPTGRAAAPNMVRTLLAWCRVGGSMIAVACNP